MHIVDKNGVIRLLFNSPAAQRWRVTVVGFKVNNDKGRNCISNKNRGIHQHYRNLGIFVYQVGGEGSIA